MLRNIYTCNTQNDYEILKRRVEQGVKFLEGKWFNEAYAKEQGHFQAMATAMLAWEMQSGIFEKEFNKWLLEEGQ